MRTDSLYYIKDYSGNYYRLNQADELVVGNECEATVFTYTQANERISVGKKAAFYCIVQADDTVKRLTNEAVAQQIEEELEKNAATYDFSAMDWEEYLTHFIYLAQGIKNYREELTKKESDTDQKICDILHYIELYETKDEEAVDLIELLRVCRENRRDIKDELHRSEYFQTHLGTSANVVKAQQALKAIKGLKTRKYKPRQYDELFENSTLKCSRTTEDDAREITQKEIVQETKMQENERRRQTFRVLPAKKEDEVTETMNERKYTIFDGRENDWVTFAKQQAEFYRNAEQYICNLQLDIDDIDDEIEEILQETEDANCNVAQGYKVFKRLKDLRVSRKAKSQELNCLYAMTDYIDCEAMADTCEANLEEIEKITQPLFKQSENE